MTRANPFFVCSYGEHDCYAGTVEDRIRMVKTFDAAQCWQALAVTNLQKTVLRAIERRLRELKRQEGKGK